MKCEEIFKDLLILLDGDLDAPKRTLVEAHLKECPVCAARLAKLQGMNGCLRDNLSHLEAVPDITDAVMSQIKAKPVGRFAWVFAAAACLFTLILCKPDSVERPNRKPHVVVQVQKQKTTPASSIPRQEEERSKGSQIVLEQKVATVDHRRPSQKKIAQLHHTKHVQKKWEPAEAPPDLPLRVELRIAGDSSSIVVAAGLVEHIVKTEPRNKTTATPPNPEASSIERPALRTVISTDPTALLIPEI